LSAPFEVSQGEKVVQRLKPHPAEATMKKNCLLIGMVVLVVVPMWVVLLDPTCVLLGWITDQSFYKGRPTMYWSRRLKNARAEALAKATAPVRLVRLRSIKDEGPNFELLHTRDAAALPVLLELLRDYDPWVRWRAACSVTVFLEPFPKEQEEALWQHQLDRLVNALQDGLSPPFDELQHLQTGEALERLAPHVPSAVPPLFRFLWSQISGLGSSEEEPRLVLGWQATETAARTGQVLLPLLIEILKGDDLEMRKAACCILEALGPQAREAIPALRTALEDRDLRLVAAEALWEVEPGNAVTVPAMIQQLQDGDKRQRLAAVKALGDLRSQRAAPAALPLVALLRELNGLSSPQEGEEEVRDVLLFPGHEALLEVEEKDLAVAILTALRHIGPVAGDAVPTLLAVFPQMSRAQRSHLAYALAIIGPQDPTAVPVLCALLRDPEQKKTRFWAARALGSLGPEARAAIPDLAALLGMALTEETGYDVQDEAFRVLEKIGPASIPALEAAKNDADPEVRRLAVISLNRIQEKAR
jgi:HEAT repeat protein